MNQTNNNLLNYGNNNGNNLRNSTYNMDEINLGI